MPSWYEPNPATGQPITTGWGNAIEDACVPSFASLSALNAGWTDAPDGAHAGTLDTGRLFLRTGGAWTIAGARGLVEQVTIPQTLNFSAAPGFIPGSTHTIPGGRMVKVEAVVLLVMHAVGDVNLWLQSGVSESWHRVNYVANASRNVSFLVTYWPQVPGVGQLAANVPAGQIDIVSGQVDVIDFGPTG